VAGCVLAGPSGGSLCRAALRRLPAALERTVGKDGGHASRSPEAGLELLLDLLTHLPFDLLTLQIQPDQPYFIRTEGDYQTAWKQFI
jgi:uncharacterized heparinase superfamily protein